MSLVISEEELIRRISVLIAGERGGREAGALATIQIEAVVSTLQRA